MRRHLIITGIYDVWPSFFIKRPIIVLPTIAIPAAIVQIAIGADKRRKPWNTLWSIVVSAEIQVGSTGIRLTAIYTKPMELSLQKSLVASIPPKQTWCLSSDVFKLWIYK
jgi:hypothetical protein